MSVEEKMDAFIKQYQVDRQEDLKKANKERYTNLSYILWGFALASIGLAATHIDTLSTVVSIIIAVAFVLLGWGAWVKSRK